jgi:hypothetical protein
MSNEQQPPHPEKPDDPSRAPPPPEIAGPGTPQIHQPPINLSPQMLAQFAAQARLAQSHSAGARAGPFFPMAISAHAQMQMWQGPYPPPDAVERYEKLLPGSFHRILTMAENMQAAQIKQSGDAQTYTQRDSRRATWLGWSIGAMAVAGAITCAYLQYPILAAAFLALPLLGLGKVIIESTKQQSAANQAVVTIPPESATAAQQPTPGHSPPDSG